MKLHDIRVDQSQQVLEVEVMGQSIREAIQPRHHLSNPTVSINQFLESADRINCDLTSSELVKPVHSRGGRERQHAKNLP